MENEMQLKTEIKAKFFYLIEPTSLEQQQSLDALNKHAEDIAEALQPIFQNLVIQMLELKRQTYGQGSE